jgi:hypothetical protein
MRASDYAKAQSLNEPPEGDHVSTGLRLQAILDALRDVELGAYDHQIVTCMANMLGDPAARTLVSLLLRVRDAGVLGMMTLVEHIEDRAKKARLEHPGGARWAAGNSGAGGPCDQPISR